MVKDVVYLAAIPIVGLFPEPTTFPEIVNVIG